MKKQFSSECKIVIFQKLQITRQNQIPLRNC